MSITQTLHDYSQPCAVNDYQSAPNTLDSDSGQMEAISSSRHEAKQHPLGVKPSGNALTSTTNAQNHMGVFGKLPDAMLLLLLEYLDDHSLLNIGSTCRGLFAYSSYDQFWRDIELDDSTPSFAWRGSWRASRRRLPSSKLPNIDCSCLFSDALYRPFQCSQLPLRAFTSAIPKRNQIVRFPNLGLADFSESWTNKPFILTEPVRQWKVFETWNEASLLEAYADTIFRAEAVDWPLRTYARYMNDNIDESPLYLFDRAFVEKMRLNVKEDTDYVPPTCFSEDLFTLLGAQRPDHRWLIIGPERSGSTFHKDPNATSAWNAVVRGSKYWIMFPNEVLPPGVYMSDDQSEVTSPLSIAEWLLTFHDEARETPGCIEAICEEGELLHVPSGWWHLVVNLEPAVAITQNFIPKSHAAAAANFLKHKADQVSGFKEDVKDPHALFMERLYHEYPDLYTELHAKAEKKRKWEEIVAVEASNSAQAGSFSFGFSSDIDDEDVP